VNERTCLDIFTGLGCFSIAARANSVRTVGMCEIKSDCRHFLAANWPGVSIHNNAKTLDGTRYKGAWLVCGGPPCQPASVAGEQRGAADHRWLWPEAVRIVRESEPTWFLFENPPGIKSVGLDGVLTDLEAAGYEVGTLDIPACGVNSPQRRQRLWIVGHAKKQPERVRDLQALPDARRDARRVALPSVECGNVANANLNGLPTGGRKADLPSPHAQNGALADSLGSQLALGQGDAGDSRIEQPTVAGGAGFGLWSGSVWIECGDGKRRRAKPGVCGVVDGPSVGLLEALGNAIVWPIAARIIAAMIESESL
jgi:site-specific DNA-cytosine methylase